MPIKFIWNETEDNIDRNLYFGDNKRIKRQTDRFCTTNIIKKFESDLKPAVMSDEDPNFNALFEKINSEELYEKFVEFVETNSMTEIDMKSEETLSSPGSYLNSDEKSSSVYRRNKSLKLMNTELQLKIVELSKAVEELEEQNECQKNIIFRLNSKLESSKDLSQEQEAFQEEYEKVVCEKNQLKETIFSLNEMIEKHKKDEIDSYKTIDKIRDENFKLEKSLNSMKKNNEVLKLDCIKLQDDFMRLDEDFTHKEKEYEKVSHLFQKEKLSVIQFKTTCQHLKEENKSLQSQIQDLKYQMSLKDVEVPLSCSSLATKQVDLLSEILEVEQANLTAQSRNSLQTETELNEILGSYKSENHQLKYQNNSLKSQISDLQMKLDKSIKLKLEDDKMSAENVLIDARNEDFTGSLLDWCCSFLEPHEAIGEANQEITRENFTFHAASTIEGLNLEIPPNKQKIYCTSSYLQNNEVKNILNQISMACDKDQSSYKERFDLMKKSLKMMPECINKVKTLRFAKSICEYSKQIGYLHSEQIFLQVIKLLVNQVSLLNNEKALYQQQFECEHTKLVSFNYIKCWQTSILIS